MTAEFPDIATKEQIPSHDLFPLLSSKTILSALPVAEQLSLRAAPDHAAVTELVNNASSDIQALGLPVTAQDVASAVEKTEEQFRSSSEQKKEEPVIVDRKRRHREVGTEVNLDEYKGVIDGLVQNYGLNKKAWERVSGLLSASVFT